MNSKKVKVVVESSKYGSLFVASEVTSSWCKLMRASLHQRSNCIALESQPNSSHFCNSVATIYHMLAPILHSVFELGEVLGNLILSNILHDITDVIEVSPFSVMRRR
jgi:hypothetical protein